MKKLVFNFKSIDTKKIKITANILGSKGANLVEMGRLGYPVPSGFTISTEVCDLFYKNNKKINKPDDNGIISGDPEIWYKKKYNYGARIKKKSKKFKKKSGKESASNFFAENNDLKKLKERLKFE